MVTTLLPEPSSYTLDKCTKAPDFRACRGLVPSPHGYLQLLMQQEVW